MHCYFRQTKSLLNPWKPLDQPDNLNKSFTLYSICLNPSVLVVGLHEFNTSFSSHTSLSDPLPCIGTFAWYLF